MSRAATIRLALAEVRGSRVHTLRMVGALMLASPIGLGAWSPPALAQQSARGFDVAHYAAIVRPDIAARTIEGTVTLRIVITANEQEIVELDRGELEIDRVSDAGKPIAFYQSPRRVGLRFAGTAKKGQVHEIEITYHGTPRAGLQFVTERSQAYTVFSTSRWLVCVDDPADKATLDLSVILPKDLDAVGSGRLIEKLPRGADAMLHRWQQDRPIPTYLFGFAAGRFIEASNTSANVALHYLAEGFSREDLARLLLDTRDMMTFFADRAGVRYPDVSYTQVLVAKTIGQEASAYSLLPEDHAHALLEDPKKLSLSAHELAHQWWGNMVTCRDWTHFWLNEGFATFMASAFGEHRFGRAAYLADVEAWRTRYEELRDTGADRSLVFPDWNRPTANDRALVYQKGAYVLHLLREELGERIFWKGIRHYTRKHFGGSVTTADFQRAMEESSGRNLSDFFSRWVYLSPAN